MKRFKASLLLHSPLATPLIGDTIFGHVCWGIKRTEGEQKLTEFLINTEKDPAYFSISSAFPANMLPIPILPLPQEAAETNTALYGKKKKNKRRKFIPAGELFQQTAPLTPERLHAILDATEEEYSFHSIIRQHNTINRITGTTDGPTGLFSNEEFFFKRNAGLRKLKDVDALVDVYIVSTESHRKVEEWIRNAFIFGFGADTSTGKGWIEITSIKELGNKMAGNRFLALGPFIPSDLERQQMSNFTYELFIRKGKIGPELVHMFNPFKKPIIFYKDGSTFFLQEPKLVIGEVLSNIHTEPFIRHAGHTPILPFVMEV